MGKETSNAWRIRTRNMEKDYKGKEGSMNDTKGT